MDPLGRLCEAGGVALRYPESFRLGGFTTLGFWVQGLALIRAISDYRQSYLIYDLRD